MNNTTREVSGACATQALSCTKASTGNIELTSSKLVLQREQFKISFNIAQTVTKIVFHVSSLRDLLRLLLDSSTLNGFVFPWIASITQLIISNVIKIK